MGRLDEATSQLERARELDPFSAPINDFLGMTLYFAHRYDEAIRQFRRTLEMHPESLELHDQIADVYEQKSMLAEAFGERQQALTLKGDVRLASSLEQAYKRSGYPGYLQKRIQVMQQSSTSGLLSDLYLAHLYAILNDQTHALDYLEHAYDERNPWLLNVQVDPAMDALRSSPRFRNLVVRVGLPQ
jgi:tetratricopeptide (TPR) repeat protein